MTTPGTLTSVGSNAPASAARVGIGGPVGSGKTALIERLLPRFTAAGVEVAVITNDLVTREDAERIVRQALLPEGRVVAVEAGACPHTVIREDPTLNLAAADRLDTTFPNLDLILLESGGDNLASTFSLDLVDYWMFVIDVGGGDDIPRKRGPGVIEADLLVINKMDIAAYVGTDLERMHVEAARVRDGRDVLLTDCRADAGVDAVARHIARAVLFRDL